MWYLLLLDSKNCYANAAECKRYTLPLFSLWFHFSRTLNSLRKVLSHKHTHTHMNAVRADKIQLSTVITCHVNTVYFCICFTCAVTAGTALDSCLECKPSPYVQIHLRMAVLLFSGHSLTKICNFAACFKTLSPWTKLKHMPGAGICITSVSLCRPPSTVQSTVSIYYSDNQTHC